METKRRIPFILVLLCLSWDQVYPQEYNDGDEFDLTNECGSNPLDLVLLVDTSDANNANYDREVRNFLSEFVEYADVNSGAVRVALVTYSTGVQIEFRLGEIDNIAGIQKAIRNVPFTPGDRNTADALEMLRRGIFFEPYGDRPDAPNALIIITSGNSNRNTGRTVPQAEALHQGGVSILVIGIGVQDEEETNGMASSPANENTFYLQSIDELSIIQDLVFVQLCAPLVNENIPEIYKAGDALDLIFLFHFSNDMSEENFRYILSYVSGLLIGADIDNGNVRVGAALYRHDGVPLFQLNQYQRKEDIINAIENIPYNYRSASASLSAGIETVRTNMFQRQAGDRDEAPNGLILITDSTSNINVNKVANEAESLHNAGVTVFGIGIGLRSTDEVRTVVSANDNTYLMRNVNQLPALTGRLQDRIPALKAILPQPTEAPTPATEPEPEPTTAAPEVITVMEPTTIENSDIADVLVVFHSSHKTKAKDFNRNLKPFLSDIFAKAKIEPNKVRVAVVNYGNRVNSLFNFNTHTTKQKARGAIRKIKARLRHSKSNLGATLRHIRTQEFSQRSGSRISQGVPGAIILVTDMPSDSGTIDALDEAELLKRSGISILTVGIGDADRSELSAISSKPEYAQYVPNYATLKSNINILENIKDTVYALQGPNSRKPPPTAIVVRTAQPIPETTLAPERVTQISKSKLAILFHASSSTSARNYNKKLLVFMSNLLEDNRLDLTKLDVGVFNFGRAPMTVFEFGAHKNKEDLQNSILKIPKSFRSPSSNLGRTLKMLNETNNVFGGLPQNVLIISDTPSVFVQEEDNRYIDRLKSANSKIYFIGISYPYDGPMQSVVSEPHSKYFYTVENYESLLNDESLKRNFVSSLLEDLDSSENGQILPILNTEPIDSEQDTRLQQSSSVKDNGKTYLAILFQSSSSTSPKDYFKNLLIFLSNLVSENRFNSSTLDVALINYGKTTRVLFNFNSQESLSSAKSAILKAPKTLRSKKANIGDALQILNRDIFNTTERNYGGRGHVVVVADKIFDHSLKTVPEANVLKNAGIKIHSIGISDKTKNDLRTISSGPDTLYFQNVGNYAELNQNPDILQRVISGIRSSPSKPEQRTTTTTQTTTTVSNTIGHVTTNNDVRHVAILFQSSSSTSPSDYFRHLLVFLSNIADEQHFLSNKTNFALVNYGKKNRVLFNFNTYRDISDVKNAITKAPKNLRSKKSNIGEALKIMNTDIFNTSERNYGGKGHLVLLSDKKFDVTKVNALEEAKLLRNSGIRIHTIGVTDKPLEDMEDLVSWPLDNYFQTVESYPELIQNPSVLQHLLANIKSSPMDPRITTLPTPSSTVTSKTPDPTEADVVLVFHALENVKKTDYKKKLLKFLFKLVKKADIDKGKVRVALVNYGNDAQTIFDLTQYKTKKTVIKAIKKTPKNLKFKNSDLGKALRLIRTSIFRPPKDRHGVQNHVILVTDSTSTGSSDQMHEEVRLLKESGVMFHTVGIGNVNKDELKFIASDPDSKHLQILKSHSELLKMKKSAKKIFKAIPALRKKKKGKGNKKPKKTKKPKTPTTTYLNETTRLTTLVPTVATDTTSVARHVKTRITTTLGDKTTRSIQPQSSPITSSSSSLSSTAAVTPTTTATSSKITTVILSTPKVTTHSPIIKTAIKRTVKTTEKLLTPVPTSTIKITETSTGRNVITTTESKILTAKPTEKQHEKQTLLPTQNMITKTKSVTTAYQSSKSITVKEKTEQQTQFPTQSIIFNTTHMSITDPPTRGETVTKKTEKQTLPTQITFTRITRKFTTDPTKEETAWKKTEKETTIQTKSMITNATQIAVTQLSTNTMRSTPIEILETNNIDKTTIPNQEDISSITAMVPVLPLADSEEADIVVAVHSSRSTSEDDFSKLKTYLKSLFAKADVNSGKVQISCIVYGRDARTIFYLNQYNTSQQVSEAIDRISPRMRDNIVDSSAALVRAREMFGYGARATVPKALFMITDSASTVKTSTVENQKALLQGDGVDIFSIGVGIRDKSELELLSTSPNNIYNVQGYGQLAGNAEELRNRVYALNTAPAPPVVTVLPGTPGPIERITPSRETGTVGPPIKITFPSPTVECKAEVDLVIIIDSSTSVGPDNYEKTKTFVMDLLRNAEIDSGLVRVGIVTYSTNVDVRFNLNTYSTKTQIFDAIQNIEYTYGSTNTAGAIGRMRNTMFTTANGDRPNVPNVAIIITDGVSNINARETIPEAEAARKANIHIYAIGIGLADTTELDQMASIPIDDNRFTVQTFDELKGFDQKIFSAICRVATPDLIQVPVTPAPPQTECGLAKVDLVFVLDSSTSVGQDNYDKMLNFLKDFLRNADIDSGSIRVGVVSYSTGVHLEFKMNDYTTQQEVFNAIDNIPYRYGSTNTADGLRKMHNEMFTARNGDREDVPNIAIVITDGVSNINSRRTIPESNAAKKKGIHVYVIGIGLTDTREIFAMATAPASENAFTITGFDELRGLDEQIFSAICPGQRKQTTPTLPATEPPPEPIDGGFSTWADWGPCSVTCGVGYTRRSRQCNNPSPQFGGANCVGDYREQISCELDPCPIDGGFSRWSDWSICSATCGRGISTRTRSCDSPAPQYGGQDCNGEREEQKQCMIQECQVPVTLPKPVSECGLAKVDLVFVLDSSTSVGQDNYDKMLKFLKDFLSNADIDSGSIRVGVVSYSTGVHVEFQMNDFTTQLEVFNAIDNIPYRYGSTNTADGLRKMHDEMFTAANGDRDGVPNIAIVITDGVSNINSRRTIPEADAAKGKGIHVYVIGIGLRDTREIFAMATAPASENAFTVTGFDELRGLDEQIFSAICPGFPKTPDKPKTVSTPSPSGYDLVVVLDSSVNRETFQWMTDFVKSLTSQLNIDGGDFRVGVMRYSSTADVQFNLKDYTTQAEMAPAIDVIDYKHGETDTAKAFEAVRTRMFRAEKGDRDFARNYILYLTGNERSLNTDKIWREAERVEDDDIGIFVVGINTDETTEIDETSTHPLSQYRFLVRGRRELMEIPGQLDYRIREMPDVPPRDWPRQRPINGGFSTWAQWESCSVTCGIGIRTRTRECNNPVPQFGGADCDGEFEEFESCESVPCPIDGRFSRWSDWSQCSKTCGLGTKTRQRSCDNPAPQYGGRDCAGILEETTECQLEKCQVTIPPQTSECGLAKVDLVFVLDSSTSVGQDNYNKMMNFLKDFLTNADIDSGSIRVGVVSYSTGVHVEFQLNDYTTQQEVFDAIDNIPYRYGSTNTADGLLRMHSQMFTARNGDRDDAPNIAIVITDGVSNINSRRTIPEADRAKEKGIHVYIIGIGLTDTREIFAMATAPASENAFTVTGFDELKGLDQQIFSAICPVTEAPPEPIDGGFSTWTEWDVCSATCGEGIKTRTRECNNPTPQFGGRDCEGDLEEFAACEIIPCPIDGGLSRWSEWTECSQTCGLGTKSRQRSCDSPTPQYGGRDCYGATVETTECQLEPCQVPVTLPPPVSECGLAKVDLVFVLDSSTSVGQGNYNKMLNFLKEFLTNADIDSGSIRVGVVSYSTGVHLEFQLNDYTTQQEVFNAIDNIPYRYGSTNTADGLLKMHNEMFTARNGDRDGVPNIAIVITDGVSNINSRRTIPEADAAKGKGIHVYVIGIGLTDTREIFAMATAPASENAFTVTGFDELRGLDEQIFSAICPGTEAPPTPIDGGFTEWTQWTKCTASCDGGITTRTRDCTNPRPQFGGKDCEGPDSDVKICGMQSCPIDGGFSTWSEWGQCSATCGKGFKDRQRLCDSPAPQNGGRDCEGSRVEKMSCQLEPCQECGLAKVDLVFILDSSTSVGQDNYNKMLNFLKEFLKNADIDSGSIRVGVVSYSTGVHVEFQMNDYTTQQEVFDAIDNIPYRYGSTNTADGLLKMHDEMFTARNGDRDGVPNIAIVITDGVSNINSRRTIPEADAAKGKGIHVYVIGIGLTDTREIFAMATAPASENAFTVTGFDELRGLDEQIFSAICPGSKRGPETEAPKGTESPPIDGGFSTWTPWGPCSVTCGPGVMRRRRQCDNPIPQNGGRKCTGPRREEQSCNLAECVVSTPPPVSDCDGQVDLVIIVDSSTSVGQENFDKTLQFCKDFLNNADIDSGNVRVGLVTYSTEVKVHFNLNSYTSKADVFTAIDNIPYLYGSTNTAGGLETMRSEMFTARNGDRPGAKNIAMIVTDGVSNINSRRTIPEAIQARDEGIHIYAVGIGLTDTRELNGMASEPIENNRFVVADFDELAGLDEQVFAALCPGQRATTPKPAVTSKTEPPVVTVPECGFARVDLVVIIDSSASVGKKNFKLTLNFVKDLLRGYDIDSGNVRVGVVTYSTGVVVRFQLNTYSTKSEVFDAIDNIPYLYGSTNTAGGLDKMRNEMFTPQNGDREDVRNLAIIITDGVSNINYQRTIPNAEEARKDGIFIYSIGIGLTDTRELDGMASPPASENSFNVQGFDELEGVGERIFRSLCQVVPTESTPRTTESPRTERKTSARPQTQKPRVTSESERGTQPPTPEPSAYDLVIILDSSVNRQTYQWMLDFSKRLTRQLNIDGGEYRVGVLRYSTNADVQFNLNDHLNQRQIRPAIDRIQHRPGQTNTAKAFETVRTQMFRPERGDRPYARNYILLLTGNEKSLDTNEIWREAERVEDDDIGIFVVGINTDDTSEIDETSTHPLLQYRYLVRSRGDLLKLPRQLDNTIRGMPDNPPSDWPRRRPRLTTTTMAPTTTTPKPTGYDLVIVLDSSVTPEIYQWMLNFAKRLTNQLNVDGGEYRVGVMSYSTYANVQFNLDDHLTQSRLSPAIERIQYRPGETNTAKALETVRTRMFRHSEGDRDYARNFILLLTGNEESLSTNDAWAAAERAEDDGIGIYVIGIDINNTNEIDEVASHPLSEYRFLVRRESDFMEIPGQMDFRLHKMPERPPRQWPRRRPRLTTPAPTRRPLPRPEKCTSVGDIVFILDSSGSVGRDNFYNVLNFTYNTVDELDIDTGHYRIGVITFSDNARTEFRLDRYNNKRDIERALTQVRYIYGSTHTAAALRLARTELFQPNGDRPDVPNVIVIVTDGESNINHLETIPEAMILKRSGVSIITVAIGFTDRSSELIGLTSPPITENLIRVESFDSLDRLKDKLVAPLCTDTDMCSPNPCQNGGRCIDGLRSYICQCTEGFHGENCNKRCGEPADVVFVLDSSNTVGRETFRRMKSYAEQLVTEMDVEVCDIRIGVMKYSSRSMVQFHVGAYRDTDTINRVIDSVSYTRGRANMAGAFNTLRRRMFHGNGDRTNVRNIAYILTDGSTDINAGNTMQEAELAIQSGIYIVPVGVSLRERGEVESIALSQGTNTIEIDSEDTFMTMRDEVLRPIFDLTDHCATNPCKHGGTCRNGGNGYTCSCVPGFTGDRCQKRCDAQGDIVFAVDTSRYSTRKELRRVKRFLRSLVKRMSFKRQGFRVGIVEYNSNAKVSLTFQNGRKKKAALAAVSGIRSRGGDPDPTEALRKAHLRIFDNEDRRNVPNYLIFVTKSMNNENNVIREANKLKVAGARIIGVGIGLTTSEKEFLSSAVSSPIPSYMYNVPNGQGLNDVADSIMTMLCDERNMCESDPCGNRGECIPTPGSYYCQCRPGYAGKTCQKACNAKADVAFLLDSSGSVGQKNFQKIKNFLIHMVDDMTIGFDATRVGVASFSDTARLAFYMDQYMTKEEVRRAISGVDYEYGNTNTASGIKLARNHILDPKRGDRKDVQNFLIIITDGLSNINAENTLKEAELAKEEGTHVISIGIGSFDPFEINAMATEPASKNAFIIDDFDRLFNISDKLVSATCRDPSVCDENPCRNGGVCTPLINGYKCKCKNGYRGTNCESACQSKKDIVFVLDSSSSVGEVNFQQMLNFVKALIEELSAPGTNNRFGLVTYSTEPNLIFSLGRYTDPGTVSTAVATTRYTPGSTNTAGGLRTAMEIFTNNYGNRRDADDVVILVTDGESNVQAYNTIPSADELKRNNIKIISIGIGIRDSDEITRIASSTDDVFQVGGFESLSGVKTDILDTSCKRNEE